MSSLLLYQKKKKKNWNARRVLSKEFLECSCTKNEVVCKKLLVKTNIFEKELEHSNLKSLFDKKWFKLDYVIGALYSFNTGWLIDKDIIIAGLKT